MRSSCDLTPDFRIDAVFTVSGRASIEGEIVATCPAECLRIPVVLCLIAMGSQTVVPPHFAEYLSGRNIDVPQETGAERLVDVFRNSSRLWLGDVRNPTLSVTHDDRIRHNGADSEFVGNVETPCNWIGSRGEFANLTSGQVNSPFDPANSESARGDRCGVIRHFRAVSLSSPFKS